MTVAGDECKQEKNWIEKEKGKMCHQKEMTWRRMQESKKKMVTGGVEEESIGTRGQAEYVKMMKKKKVFPLQTGKLTDKRSS